MAGVQIDGVNNKIDFDDDQDTSISSNTDDTLVIEAGGNTMATITATTFTINDGTTITTADNTDTLTLTSTDADAGVGPNIVYYRNSSSPANDDYLGEVTFRGRNNNSQDVDFARINARLKDVADGSEDAQIIFNVMTAGSEVETLRFGEGATVFNEGSADQDFRVESNGNAHMLFVDAGNDRVGINTNSPSQALHVVGDVQLTDAHPTISFTDSDDNSDSRIYHSAGAFLIDADNNNEVSGSFFRLSVDDTENLRAAGQKISTGGEDAPDCDAGGLTLDQNANDSFILTFKSSDFTGGADEGEADTFGAFAKSGANDGGLHIIGVTEAGQFALNLKGSCDTASVTETTSGSGYGVIATNAVQRDSGGSTGHLGANANMNVFLNNASTRIIFKGDGEIFSDQSATVGTFDTYEDAQLVRAYELSAGRYDKGLIDSKFDEFVQYNAKDLADANLIGKEENGTPNTMVNITGMQRLHNGAIWQQYEKHQKLANAFYKLAQKTIGKEEADKLLTEEEIQLLN